MGREGRERGFSLVELMVGIVIIGIVLVAAVPNFVSYRETQRMHTTCDRLAAACRDARSRARARNHQIVMEYRTDANEVAIIDDVNDNGAADADEAVEVYALPEGASMAGTSFANDQLVFNSRGRALAGGSITISVGDHVDPLRVRVSAGTGEVRVVPVGG